MGRREIGSKFDDIVRFAEVEKFLEVPIKRYSSGMYLRLAFAVAAYLEPDVLIADEVLAVGDQQFQAKCLGKMREVSEDGRTVIFVSHNMHAVRSLCRTGLLLQKGSMLAKAPVEEAIEMYSQAMEADSSELPFIGRSMAVTEFSVQQNGRDSSLIDGGRPMEVTVRFSLPEELDSLRMGIKVTTGMGDELVRSLISDWDRGLERLGAGRYQARLEFPDRLLASGNYVISLTAFSQGSFDLLEGRRIERTVNISSPLDFNSGGPADPFKAQVMLNRRWEVEAVRSA